MDRKENVETNNLPVEPETNEFNFDEEVPVTHKYVDRSEDADNSEEEFVAGAVWHGPAFTPEDEDAERRRVRAIIEQNAAPVAAEENTEPEVKKKAIKPWLKIVFLIAVILIVGAIIFGVYNSSKKDAHPDETIGQGQQPTEDESGETAESTGPAFANHPDMTEEEIKAQNFPREQSMATPAEFFTTKTSYSDYQYYYFYVTGVISGFDEYAGTNIVVIDTALGQIMLLDAMFTLPEFQIGDTYYFYYMYIGFDNSLDAVYGAYVDHSVENEGIPESAFASYTDGTYVVGVDIEADEYFFYPTAQTGGQIQIFGDDKYIEKILSLDYSGGYYLTLSDGMILTVKNTQFAKSSAMSLEIGSTLYAFMYRVGADIAPGTYRLTPDGIAQSQYIIYNSSDARTRQIVEEAILDKDQVVITVEEGQYLHLIHCYGAAYDQEPSSDEPVDTPEETDEPTNE